MMLDMTPSRQYKYQKKRGKEGLCRTCGINPLLGSTYCAECLEKSTERQRERQGFQPWQPGKRGRPPLKGKE
jgi:hypothetical protein